MSNPKLVIRKEYAIAPLLDQLEQQTRQWLQDKQIHTPVMVGIHTAGVWLAQALHTRLGLSEALGELDVTFYRDDFSRIGLAAQNKPSRIPFSIENRHVLLVDDVIYTGRTLRGAMNELFDYGCPASITLVVLVDRGGRELPIEPQIAALHEEIAADLLFEVSGADLTYLRLVNRA